MEYDGSMPPVVTDTQPDQPSHVTTTTNRAKSRLRLRFTVPKGKASSLMGVTLHVENGELTEQEYEDKIKEAFRQMGVDVREE